MARTRTTYRCRACGASFAKWMGQCPSCAEWNSLEQTLEGYATRNGMSAPRTPAEILQLSDLDTIEVIRLQIPLIEWDRVLGGGLVPGSVVLLGGDPGVGKSTLALQVAGALASTGQTVIYVSGEESPRQISLRARRLHVSAQTMGVTAETDVEAVITGALLHMPQFMVVDSIQSIWDPALEAPAGSLIQLRECTLRLLQFAKAHQIAVLLIGHVTKEGAIAGPKVLEHMVDAVIYLEGERLQAYRLLRGVKNRFGATNEVGVFEMQERGLVEVLDPSAAFLGSRVDSGPGSAVVVTMEGTRPILVEVQALVSRTALAVPRRVANGIDYQRLILLTAVLAKRGGLPLHEWDVHVNVVSGLRIEETGADLGAALAILSSYEDMPMDSEMVAVGEIGLSGELRSVGQMDVRLREAAKLGFRRAIVPRKMSGDLPASIEARPAANVQEAARLAGLQFRGNGHRFSR